MKGNSLSDFINDLLTMGGPEKEFQFREKKFFLETVFNKERELNELYIIECTSENPYIFRCFGKNFTDCVEQFEKARIFDGMTIYEAEREIEVLYG